MKEPKYTASLNVRIEPSDKSNAKMLAELHNRGEADMYRLIFKTGLKALTINQK
jgi:hypothetical protein